MRRLKLKPRVDGLLRSRAQADQQRAGEVMLREEMAAVIAAGGDPNSLVAAVAPAAASGDAPPAAPAAAPQPVLSDVEKMDKSKRHSAAGSLSERATMNLGGRGLMKTEFARARGGASTHNARHFA